MSLKFKVIKYKHQREAAELKGRIERQEVTQEELTKFIMGLVEAWDYKDEETGEAIPVGEYDELSLKQYGEVVAVFNSEMSQLKASVPKVNGSGSQSGLTESKPARGRRQNHPTG